MCVCVYTFSVLSLLLLQLLNLLNKEFFMVFFVLDGSQDFRLFSVSLPDDGILTFQLLKRKRTFPSVSHISLNKTQIKIPDKVQIKMLK